MNSADTIQIKLLPIDINGAGAIGKMMGRGNKYNWRCGDCFPLLGAISLLTIHDVILDREAVGNGLGRCRTYAAHEHQRPCAEEGGGDVGIEHAEVARGRRGQPGELCWQQALVAREERRLLESVEDAGF